MANDTAEHSWRGGTDGTPLMLRMMVRCFRYMPLWFCYMGMALVVPFYMLLRRSQYSNIYHYYRRTLHRGPLSSFAGVYANHYRFGQMLIDRFGKYAGKRFRMDIEGGELFDRLARRPESFVILSAHIGNFEMAGYTLVTHRKPINALVYYRDAETVMQNREIQFGETHIRMITVRPDMSHLFHINRALSSGEIVSFPADRFVGAGRSIDCTLLGRDTRLPAGPFLTVAQRDVEALAIHVMRTGYRRYKVVATQVTDAEADRQLRRNDRAAAVARRYAATVDRMMEEYPSQWFNYLNFWND